MAVQLFTRRDRPSAWRSCTRPWLLLATAMLACLALMQPPAAHAQQKKPNGIDYSMYFLASVRDHENCAMTVSPEGKWSVDPRISNPAMTCPDMTSWRLFATAIRDSFWSDWADEVQNWPQEPWPLCSATVTANCCTPGSPKNDATHCPFFPGSVGGSHPAQLRALPPTHRTGRPSITHQLQALGTAVELDKAVTDLKKSLRAAAPAATTSQCPDTVIKQLVPKSYESIGRVIRQTNAEVTIRNRSFHEYLFANNLYNSDGVAAIFTANANNQKTNAPYAADSRSAGRGQPAALSRIDFPADAIMIKSNWLYEGIAAELGIANAPGQPFITQNMTTTVQYTDGKKGVDCKLTGTHYLMAFHVSSKDIPNWVWTTFEHVAMPGRCDFIGCNDAYGYSSTDPLPAGAARNYVAPHVKSDGLVMAPATVFDRDKTYPAEKINPGLDQVFRILGIGTSPSTNKDRPSIGDLGWRSYRLKGSQVEFVSSMGRHTLLGNSITEAGFMNGSSCITCHARAGVHVDGSGTTFLRLSVFEKDLSDYGYGSSAHGVPNPAWFHNDNNAGTLDVLQADFVWGFLNAQPLAKK
jgi:hypothetical protein